LATSTTAKSESGSEDLITQHVSLESDVVEKEQHKKEKERHKKKKSGSEDLITRGVSMRVFVPGKQVT
jgi:hypothetical protein